MFDKAGPKRLGQDVVSGGVLAALATAYVDAINGGAVPTIATAWQVPFCGSLAQDIRGSDLESISAVDVSSCLPC